MLEKTLATQELKFDEIRWGSRKTWRTREPLSEGERLINQDFMEGKEYKRISVDTKPAYLVSGMNDDENKPYWLFDYKLDSIHGLKLFNIRVKDTQPKHGPEYKESVEPVFHTIIFDEFQIKTDQANKVQFNVERALTNPLSFFEIGEASKKSIGAIWGKPGDDLYQRGLKLTLIDNILDTGEGDNSDQYCQVKLELSVVFRGAKNDFDPGGIPVALDLFPQIGWTWYNENATTKVEKFRGTVKTTVMNHMHMDGEGNEMMKKNVATFYADSNTSLDGKLGRAKYYGFLTWAAALDDKPRSWGTIFDYADVNLNQEKEFTAVSYDSYDNFQSIGNGNFERKERTGTYRWLTDYEIDVENSLLQKAATGYAFFRRKILPTVILAQSSSEIGIPFNIAKHARQGGFDNIHIHAKMMPNQEFEPSDEEYGDEYEPVHAPFCGHSCVHFHWRWSSFSVDGAKPDGKKGQYMGWSTNKSNSEVNSPLIPPNQKLTVALTNPGRIRPVNVSDSTQVYNWDDDPILGDPPHFELDGRFKELWYSIDVKNPNAREPQVILEQGLGWAYRYTRPGESPSESYIDALVFGVFGDDLPWDENDITQEDMSKFFAEKVYPDIRFIDGEHKDTGVENEWLQQIPNSSFKGDNDKSLEDL